MEETRQQLLSACTRIINSQSKLKRAKVEISWDQLVSKISLLDDVEPFSENSVRSLLFQYAMLDLDKNWKLINTWAWKEYWGGLNSGNEVYEMGICKLIMEYAQIIQEEDTALLKVLNNVPLIPKSCLSLIEDIVLKGMKNEVGINILKSIVLSKPKLRLEAIKIMLNFSQSIDTKLRTISIETLNELYSLYEDITLSMQRFSRDNLSCLLKEEFLLQENEEEENEVENKVLAKIELFLKLSLKSQELLKDLFDIYSQLDTKFQSIWIQQIEILASKSNPDYQPLIQIICCPPNGAQDLAYHSILGILKTHNDREGLNLLLQEIKANFLGEVTPLSNSNAVKSAVPIKFLLPLIKFYNKEEMYSILDKLIQYLSDGEIKNTEGIFTIIIQSKVLNVDEVVVHLIEFKLDNFMKGIIKALKLCLSDNKVFTPELVFVGLHKLADKNKPPALLMRSIIEFIKANPDNEEIKPLVQRILHKIVQRKTYNDPTLFKGFVMVCELIDNTSHPILLQLPKQLLEKILNQSEALKQALTERVLKSLKANPSDTKERLKDLLSLFVNE